MKTFSVLLKYYAVVVVEAEDDIEAMEIAQDETRHGELAHEETIVEGELITPEGIAQAKRFAEKFIKYQEGRQ